MAGPTSALQTEDAPSWDKLPIPAIEEISRHLDAPDQKSARLACWQWYRGITREMGCQLDLLPDAGAWQRQLQAMLSREDGIQRAEVYISSRVEDDVAAEQISALTRMTSLHSLTVNTLWAPYDPIIGHVPTLLPPTITLLSTLTCLDISHGHGHAPSPSQLCCLAALPRLRSLSFSVSADQADVSTLAILTQLEALRIQEVHEHLRQIPAIMLQSLLPMAALQDLQLPGFGCSWQQLSHLVACLTSLTHVLLNLDAGSTDEGFSELREAAEQLEPSEPLTVIQASRRQLAPGSPGNPLLSLTWFYSSAKSHVPTVMRAVWGLAPNLKALDLRLRSIHWMSLVAPKASPADMSTDTGALQSHSTSQTPRSSAGATLIPRPRFPNLVTLSCKRVTQSNVYDDIHDPEADPAFAAASSCMLAWHPNALTAFHNLPSLRCLAVRIDEGVKDAFGCHLEAWLACLPALTSLKLTTSSMSCRTPCKSPDLAVLSRLQHLQHLELDVKATVLQLPLGCLPTSLTNLQCTCLEVLDPADCDSLPGAALACVEATHQHRNGVPCPQPPLEWQPGTSGGLAWGGLHRLQHLQLFACWINDDTLAQLLRGCPELLSLGVSARRHHSPQRVTPTCSMATTPATAPSLPLEALHPGSSSNGPCSDGRADSTTAFSDLNQRDNWLGACPVRLTRLNVWEHARERQCNGSMQLMAQQSLEELRALTRLRRLYINIKGVNQELVGGAGFELLQKVLMPLRRLQDVGIFGLPDEHMVKQLQPLPLADANHALIFDGEIF